MRILIINGPNLNLLGTREPEVYGHQTLDDLITSVQESFPGHDIIAFQSNHEGAIVDRIQESMQEGIAGLIINAGALSHYSIAILDALRMVKVPKIEVHISHIYTREAYRQHSTTALGCDAMMTGLGTAGYALAVQWLIDQQTSPKPMG